MRAGWSAALASVCLLAACASRMELTERERALYASVLDAAKESPRRFALVLEATSSGGEVSDMHAIVDGDRTLLVGLDPLGVSLKAILREDLLWLRARGPGGREVLAKCEGPEARDPAEPVGRILAALRALRPFDERPLPVGSAPAAWLTDEHLVVEGPAGAGGLVERRTYRRSDLALVRREVLDSGTSLAAVEPEGDADRLRLLIPRLSVELRMRVLERDPEPVITGETFEPDGGRS